MMNTKFHNLNCKEIFAIPVGTYFGKQEDSCYLVYSPLANIFYLSLPDDVMKLEEAIIAGQSTELLDKLLILLRTLRELMFH